MITKLKNLSLVSKILYILALILFVVWVLPKISNYYLQVSAYQKNLQEIGNLTTKHNLSNNTKKFSKELFKKDTQTLFSSIKIDTLPNGNYKINISIKKEDLHKVHTFIETISLRYYVELQNSLEFKTEKESIHIKMTLKSL